MATLYLRQNEGDDLEEVERSNPLPVVVVEDVQSQQIQVRSGDAAQVVVTTASTVIVQANQARRSLLLTNLTGTQLCYLSTQNPATSSNARAVLTGAVGSSITIATKEAIYGISAVASQTIMVWEEEYVNL